jgi:hypothetical protein
MGDDDAIIIDPSMSALPTIAPAIITTAQQRKSKNS